MSLTHQVMYLSIYTYYVKFYEYAYDTLIVMVRSFFSVRQYTCLMDEILRRG